MPTAVAAVVTLVPEGLILLASLTYAVAALRMARRGALAQQLNAIESLASVDVVCLDKTGTLTEPALRVVELVGPDELADELARYAASATARNATLEAIAAAYPAEPEPVRGAGAVLLAAALRRAADRRGRLRPRRARALPASTGSVRRAERAAGEGRRVLAFGIADVARAGAAARPWARPARRAAASGDARDRRVLP